MIPILEHGGFIVNTDTSNLPGQHWIAVYINQSEIQVFDPLGFYYPALLVNTLMRMNTNVVFNRIRCQPPNTTICGQCCLLWLAVKIL